MTWAFDQAPNVAYFASASVFAGEPVLLVTHFEDDHSWAFLDGKPFDPSKVMVVSMTEVLDRHPELIEIAHLEPGCSAEREGFGLSWTISQDEFD